MGYTTKKMVHLEMVDPTVLLCEREFIQIKQKNCYCNPSQWPTNLGPTLIICPFHPIPSAALWRLRTRDSWWLASQVLGEELHLGHALLYVKMFKVTKHDDLLEQILGYTWWYLIFWKHLVIYQQIGDSHMFKSSKRWCYGILWLTKNKSLIRLSHTRSYR